MEYHEAANLFPMMAGTDLGEFKDDIRSNGLQDSIKTLGGKIIDGRNRYVACVALGIKPRFEAVPDGTDPIAYVLSHNLHRRHLSQTQKAMVAGRAREMYDRQAKDRQRARKGNQPGATKENLPDLSTGQARDQVGKVVGVSGKSVDHATKVIRDGTPSLIAAVDADQLAVSTAARAASMPPEEQDRLADRAAAAAANGHRRRPRPSSESAPPDEPDPDNDPEARKVRGRGIELAHEAINCLSRIPKNDALRKRGFQLVADWIRRNQRGS